MVFFHVLVAVPEISKNAGLAAKPSYKALEYEPAFPPHPPSTSIRGAEFAP